jgi:hypothetical protein
MKIKFDCLRFSLKQSNVIISHIIFNKYNLLMLNFLFTFLYSYTSSRKHQPRVGNNILWSCSMGRIFCFQKTKFLIFFFVASLPALSQHVHSHAFVSMLELNVLVLCAWCALMHSSLFVVRSSVLVLCSSPLRALKRFALQITEFTFARFEALNRRI